MIVTSADAQVVSALGVPVDVYMTAGDQVNISTGSVRRESGSLFNFGATNDGLEGVIRDATTLMSLDILSVATIATDPLEPTIYDGLIIGTDGDTSAWPPGGYLWQVRLVNTPTNGMSTRTLIDGKWFVERTLLPPT
jgi:hypothetical protein